MILQFLILIVGFVILIKGADIFVDGASSMASNLKVSKMLIGLTIVAFGTSAPEFAVSVKSFIAGQQDIVLGNVIGSNIINILLILGITSMINPLKVTNNTVKKELPIVLLGTVMLSSLLMDNFFDKNVENILTRGDSICILLFFGVFLYYLISVARKNKKDMKEVEEPQYKLIPSIIYTIFGIIAIVIGSNVVVDSSVNIAAYLKVPERIIALTIIALGTSLPELTTSIVAALKKEEDLAVGNIIGSNIFNIGMVIGIPTLIFGKISSTSFTYLDIFMFILSSLVLFLFSFSKKEIARKEGFIMFILFIIYYVNLVIV